ncbi:hypothetical protein GM51_12875 [freshwater metagenome]|uniref:Uncharacterized protein n=1 Tax=freshwater metagenome TaxID=449393 RepID=A0A094SDP4_9ZZZZ
MRYLRGIRKSAPLIGGWRSLTPGLLEVHVGQRNLNISRVLLNLIHISDTHICDSQSPARVEFLDRYADPHHPFSSILGSLVGTYRAQEFLTTQVLESMIQAINSIDSAPVSGMKISTVLITGDMTDNAQKNEMKWFANLLQGGTITPDSGSSLAWEGIGGSYYSPHYWNPHGTPIGEKDDFPRSLYGFPVIPEILDAARSSFSATGLRYPWLAVHGNHDALLQGTVVPDEFMRALAQSSEKIMELPDDEAINALQQVTEVGPARYPNPVAPIVTPATPDSTRDFVQGDSWDGFILESAESTSKKIKYWRKDYDEITLLALDTVNPFGGWQGSIDFQQFEWLKTTVESLRDRYCVITSHHPVEDIINGYTPHLESRILGVEIEAFLVSQPHVIAWICGHTHQNRISYHGPHKSSGFWQIETSSLIDWPQEGRIIEFLLTNDDEIYIALTQINHYGELRSDINEYSIQEVNDLAGISRLLSVNDWQRRQGKFAIESNEGNTIDRSRLLHLPKRI